MPNYGGRKSSGGSGSSDFMAAFAQAGDGILVKHGTQFSTIEAQGLPPMHVKNGSGLGGNLQFEMDEWIGRRLHIDLAVAGNTAIHCRSALFIPRRIIFTMARGVVTTLAATVETAIPGRADVLWTIPKTKWAELTDDLQVIELNVPTARRSFDYLNVNVTTANSVPFRASCWIFGDTLIQNDLRGRAF